MENKNEPHPDGQKAGAYRGGYWLAVFVALIGLAGSFYLWNTRQRSEEAGLAVAFRVESDNVIVSIRRELNQYFDVLESVGHLHSLSPDVSADVFNEFVQKGMLYQQRILGVFGLAPRIDGPDRAPYEAAMRRQVRPDFSLVEWKDAGWVPASQQELYFPVSYLAPNAFQDIPVGYDLHSDAENARAMIEAVEQGRGRAGGVVRGRRGTGRLVFSPIQSLMPGLHNGGAGGGYAFGYAFAVIYPAEVIDRILRNHTPEGLDVEVFEGKGQDAIRLYLPESKGVESTGSLRVERALQINGLDWTVVCRASRAFIEQRKTRMPWIYLAGGLLLTLVVAGQIAQLAGRTARIRRLVAERTGELEQANRELEREIRQRHELQRQIIDISTQEKKRVGRDLHDSLGQQLTGIGLLTSALAKRLDQTKQEEVAGQARQIVELLKEARVATRRMAHGLTPVELDVEALPEALEKLTAEIQSSSGISCAFEWWGRLEGLNNDQVVNLYHIAQEALNNAVRHAGAKNIRVELGTRLLKISDDGSGLPSEEDRQAGQGLGLKIMQYRAETAGGQLSVESLPDGGVMVVCTLDDVEPNRKQEEGWA